MAEVLMDHPLSPAPTLSAHYTKLIQDIKDCINDLKQEFDESGGYPINDDFQPLHRLCGKLEYLLQAGLKERTTLLGVKKDYWNYICDCLSSNKSLDDSIRAVKSHNELQTNQGRGRALLRFCLMHQRLADTMQQCVLNKKITGDWYHPKSVWFDQRLISELLNSLYDLNDMQFDLAQSRDCNLDASWPNFARRNLSGGLHSWSSRSTSLSSIPTLEVFTTPLASSPISPDPGLLRLQSEASEAKSSQQLMAEQLKTAEQEKTVAETELEVEKKDSNVRINELEKEVLGLKAEIIEVQRKCMEKEIENEKLSVRLQLASTVSTEKEEMLRVRAEEAEKLLVALKEDFQSSTKAGMTANEKFDIMELRGQLVVMKKRNQALQMNVKSAELELGAKIKVDEKKTTLIDLLDKKLAQQKQKVDYLFTTTEQVVKEKEQTARKLKNASEELSKLSDRYVESQKISNELRKNNNQFKTMLKSLEGKKKKVPTATLR